MEDVKDTAEVVSENTDSEESNTFTAEDAKKLREEAKKYRKDKAALKKEFEDTQKKLEALEAEKLSDVEKKEKRIKELEDKLGSIESQAKQAETDNLILKHISGKNIVDVETAMLLIHKEIASEDEVNDATVSKIISNVIKTKPFLVSSEVKPSAGNFSRQSNEAAKNPDEMFGEFLNT